MLYTEYQQINTQLQGRADWMMPEKAVEEIKQRIQETEQRDPKFMDLDLSEIQIERFNQSTGPLVEKYYRIEILYLVGCGLRSLDGFPKLNLIAIDLSQNELDDNSNLRALTSSPNLEQVLLNHNRIHNLQTIAQLFELKNLYELDFRGNPISSQAKQEQQTYSAIQALFKKHKKLEFVNCRNRDGELCLQEDYNGEEDEQDQEEDDIEDDPEVQLQVSEQNQSEEKGSNKNCRKKKTGA